MLAQAGDNLSGGGAAQPIPGLVELLPQGQPQQDVAGRQGQHLHSLAQHQEDGLHRCVAYCTLVKITSFFDTVKQGWVDIGTAVKVQVTFVYSPLKRRKNNKKYHAHIGEFSRNFTKFFFTKIAKNVNYRFFAKHFLQLMQKIPNCVKLGISKIHILQLCLKF
jgi:hypothetical protein